MKNGFPHQFTNRNGWRDALSKSCGKTIATPSLGAWPLAAPVKVDFYYSSSARLRRRIAASGFSWRRVRPVPTRQRINIPDGHTLLTLSFTAPALQSRAPDSVPREFGAYFCSQLSREPPPSKALADPYEPDPKAGSTGVDQEVTHSGVPTRNKDLRKLNCTYECHKSKRLQPNPLGISDPECDAQENMN
jgi:hypothetical protein